MRFVEEREKHWAGGEARAIAVHESSEPGGVVSPGGSNLRCKKRFSHSFPFDAGHLREPVLSCRSASPSRRNCVLYHRVVPNVSTFEVLAEARSEASRGCFSPTAISLHQRTRRLELAAMHHDQAWLRPMGVTGSTETNSWTLSVLSQFI